MVIRSSRKKKIEPDFGHDQKIDKEIQPGFFAMVKHIVMWKLHESAEGRSKSDNAQLMKQWLEQLKIKIAEIEHLEVGINFTDAEDAYDVVLYAEFRDRGALDRYQTHPEHIGFKQRIQNLRRDKKVVDYEI